MTIKRKQPDKKPVDLKDEEIEQVSGGKKPLPVGFTEDPCAGGQITKSH